MTLTELLEKIGNENLQLQLIHESFVAVKECKDDIEITFATEKRNTPLEGSCRAGIVVWMDSEKYNEAIK